MANVLGELVLASAQDRTLRYKVLPYGEQSAVMSSGHQFQVEPGAVELPTDPSAVHVNEEHDRTRPIGRFTSLEELPDGIYGTVSVADTTAGNDALALASAGLRRGISVEIGNLVIRGGKLLKGTLEAAALVVAPSFGSALAQASALPPAPDQGDLAKDLEDAAAAIAAAQDRLAASTAPSAQDTTEPPAGPSGTATASTAKEDSMTVTATKDAGAAAAAVATAAAAATAVKATAANALLALGSALQAVSSPLSGQVAKAAALDNIVQADVFDAASVPEYVGELWKGRRYQGRYLDLVADAPMVSQSVIGWRWIDGKTPQVARWTPVSGGTMNDIPTNEVKAEQKTYNGFRIAGGHQVDRIHVDLPNAEWWASYNLESADDYARKLDAEIIAHVTDPANVTGLVLDAGATYEDQLLEGIGAAIEFADPDHILVGWNVFKFLALQKMLDQKAVHPGEFAQAGGAFKVSYLDIPLKVAPRSLTDVAERVQVGSKNANVLHSLPGGPIRVDAEEVQKGAIQHGVFGYHILRPTDTRGSINVTVAPAG
ncbi:major capsid and protease fusion protein [Arthrobacter phage Noely]|uniref:Major capsid and protease fusion protein n=1 Tax=Arthrobacter phage Noely TaxID=2419964 RepID=A0A3G2KAD9_9CAUD|nr:major capsid and protease fusion protein [Arthrobacter phage Noely]AYN55946.1 major capsid and protease fusion protein [Arthrobacter phage Noely]